MDSQALARRAEIARRLKAARWLAGEIRETDKGNGWEVAAITPEALAKRAPLPEDKITADKLGRIERMERHTPPMELRSIAQALGLQADWFSVEVSPKRADALDLLQQALGDLGLGQPPSGEEAPSDADDTDRPEEDGGADVA